MDREKVGGPEKLEFSDARFTTWSLDRFGIGPKPLERIELSSLGFEGQGLQIHQQRRKWRS